MTNTKRDQPRESLESLPAKQCETALQQAVLTDLAVAAAAFDEAGERLAATANFDALVRAIAPSLEGVLDTLAGRPSERDLLRRKVEELRAGTTPGPVELRRSMDDHSERILLVTMSRHSLESMDCLVLTVQDSSRGSRLRQELDSLARLAAVGQLTATVAHEINNIMTSMLGWTDIAKRSVNAATVVLPALEILEANAKRAKALLGRLLPKARSELSEQGPANLESVIDDVVRLLSWELSESSIRVVRRIETVPPILASEEQLHQVIVNLVRNAKDAMPSGGMLAISLAMSSEGPVLTIEDSGEGIPEDILPRIFEPFFSTKRRREPSSPGGTGLGLAICRDIVEDSGGYIEVASRVGQGTSFQIHLLAAKVEAPATLFATPQPDDDVLAGASVLVVDDERDVGDMIVTALSFKGAQVTSASRGEAAIALCEQHRFDTAFVDFTMPGLSGRELVLALQSAQPGMSIVIMSGREANVAGLPGVVDFLKKPFDLLDIETKLRSILSSNRSPD